MYTFAFLRLRQAQPTSNRLETDLLAGLLTEIGVISSLIRSLDEDEAQQVVTRCGEYLRHALEKQLGYDAMERICRAAGLGPDSHLRTDPYESRASGPDQEDYGHNLTGKQRLADRAQRLDNVTMAIAQFGFEGLRRNQQHVCKFLRERGPKAVRVEGYE